MNKLLADEDDEEQAGKVGHGDDDVGFPLGRRERVRERGKWALGCGWGCRGARVSESLDLSQLAKTHREEKQEILRHVQPCDFSIS